MINITKSIETANLDLGILTGPILKKKQTRCDKQEGSEIWIQELIVASSKISKRCTMKFMKSWWGGVIAMKLNAKKSSSARKD